MQNTNKKLFEETPVPQAVQTMMIPTIIGALVTVLYSLADTLFVGMMNDQIQNAAVALAAPALLAFNAVINLFGIGSSSMMSRALGRGDLKTVCAKMCIRDRFLVDIDKVMMYERTMPDEFINEEGNGVTEAFKEWCKPLIGGELPKMISFN